MEDDVDELPDSYFSEAAARVFYKIYNRQASVLPLSKLVYFIEILGEGFHSEELTDHLQKVYPKESGSLECFDFVRFYLDKEVYHDSTEEAERLVGWG